VSRQPRQQRRLQAPSRFGPVWGRPIAWMLVHCFWRAKIRGKDNVPRKGPVIIIANHVGFIDGPVATGVTPRYMHVLVKGEMFRGAVGPILRGSGQIEVWEGGREALARGRGVLQRGGVVGVFPEGTRGTGDAASVAGGAAWLAIHGGAPVVPLALLGTRHTGESVNVWPPPGRRIVAEFGEPILLDLPTDARGRERQQLAEQILADGLRAHVRGVAADAPIQLPQDDPLREGRTA
jgi:1-acyl-sn-glycerol-3-phosphate acyltransferase